MELTRDLSYKFPLMRGEDVRAVQAALISLNIPCGSADGIYGPATAEAVRTFQGTHGLDDDGVVGRNTRAALFSAASSAPSPIVQAVNKVLTTTATMLPEGTIGTLDDPPRLTAALEVRAANWILSNFGPVLAAAVQGKSYDTHLILAIACHQAAADWLRWIDRLDPAQVLGRCVFDASGDVPNSSRGAFPRNTAEFRQRYGDAFTRMLINEANETRRLRNFNDAQIVYKGYGLFQYDLQHIVDDEAFFRDRRWGDFGECARRVILELDRKVQGAGSLREVARRYNGSGRRAEEYGNQVMMIRRRLLSAIPPEASAAPERVAAPAAAVAPSGGGPYIAQDPERFLGRTVGTGHCVPYVQQAAGAPLTAEWHRGDRVKGNTTIEPGTAIATFDPDGHYGNHTDGTSHAAVYISQADAGLTVLDQWLGQPVHERLIRFGGDKVVNDGDQFFVIV